jgi:hypothetical protein
VYYVSAFATEGETAWLYRPGVRTQGITGLRFKLAVSEAFDNTATTEVDDDTLKVVYSDNCGVSWKTAGRFSKADVTSGRISNVLKTFIVPFGSGAGTYSVGFEFVDNNTLAQNSYRWHLDDLEFVSSVNVEANAALQPVIPQNLLLGNCPNRVLPISAVIVNQGVSNLDTVVLGYRYNNGAVHSETFLTHILPGGRDTLSFSQANLVAPAATGTVRLRIFSINAQDQQRSNDTLSLSFAITPAQPMPGSTLAGLNAAVLAGYTQAKTRAELPSATNVFTEGTSFGPAAHSVQYTATAANVTDGAAWLISPMYYYNVGGSLYFNTAVTSGTSGTGVVASIASDSLKVLYRLRCGIWQPLGVFTQAELTAGLISNRLQAKGYQVPAAAPDSLQFAFEIARGATGAASTYRWHINGIRIADEPLGTRPVLQLPALSLYPVPAHSAMQVSFGKSLTNAALRITDLSGRVLITAKAGGTAATLNVRSLTAGMYLLTVETGEGQLTRPFTVE